MSCCQPQSQAEFVKFDLLDGSPIRIRPENIKYYFFCVDSNTTRICLSECDMFDVKQTVEQVDEVMTLCE